MNPFPCLRAKLGTKLRTCGLRLYVALAVLVVVIASLVVYANYQSNNQVLKESVTARRQKLTAASAMVIKSEFDSLVNIAVSLANRPLVRQRTEAQNWYDALNTCEDALASFPEIERLFMTDASGVIVSDLPIANPSVIGQSRADKDWFKGVSKKWQPYVSEIYLRGAEPRINVMAVAAPIRDAAQNVVGVLVLQIKLGDIVDWLREAGPDAPAFMYVVDQRGNVLGHPSHPVQGQITNYSNFSIVQKVLRGESGIEQAYNPYDQAMRLSAYEPVPDYGWGVIFAEPTESVYASVRSQMTSNFLRSLALLALVVLAVAAIIALGVAERRQNRRVLELKDQFLFLAAHELRTPVTAIKWGSDLVESELKEGTATISEVALVALKGIQANAKALGDLVNDLLDSARLDYGSFKLTFAPCDLGQKLTETVASLKGLAASSGIKIHLALPTDKVVAATDGQRLGEVITNLVSNGIKYNREDGHVDITLGVLDGRAAISVSDNGLGLSPEDIGKLFQRFSRIDTPETKGIQGTGLGLFIVKRIVGALGGDIRVNSPGRGLGSTFTVTLPLTPWPIYG